MAIDLETKLMLKRTKMLTIWINREVSIKDSTLVNVLALETHAEIVETAVLQKDATKGDKTHKLRSMWEAFLVMYQARTFDWLSKSLVS